MAILTIPDKHETLTEFDAVKSFLNERGVLLERWEASAELADDATQEAVLAAYDHALTPYMKAHGYAVADVVVLHPGMENIPAIRAKFLAEHTHTEDEVRFFVDGEGLFWFHKHNDKTGEDEVFSVLCQRGDLMSVPKGVTHWFDCGEKPFVKAIRIFIDKAGWVPQYTGSGIEKKYAS